jgi:F-type H+-transporting ATPase subunit a
LASIFYFIFFMNLLEIVPGVNFPVTSRMAIPALLAILTYIIFNAVGIRKQGWAYFKDTLFPPGVPWPIYLILTPIELLSTYIIRPFTLSIRLLANMMAGHVLLTIFFLFSAQLVAPDITLPLGILTALIAAVLILFELLVISIQAFIFTTLTAFYIAEALHGHGEADPGVETQHPDALQETEGVAATAGAR